MREPRGGRGVGEGSHWRRKNCYHAATTLTGITEISDDHPSVRFSCFVLSCVFLSVLRLVLAATLNQRSRLVATDRGKGKARGPLVNQQKLGREPPAPSLCLSEAVRIPPHPDVRTARAEFSSVPRPTVNWENA